LGARWLTVAANLPDRKQPARQAGQPGCEYQELDMTPPSAAGIVHPDDAGHIARAHPCPVCNGDTYRVHRRFVDLLTGLFLSVRRYRCSSTACDWEGNLRR
jgi:hypothetical protein